MSDSPKPVVLVEDNSKDLELTLVALERARLASQVITLRDGAEALDYMFRQGAYRDRAKGNPAVILLDLKLPKIDGLQVLEKIKADPVTRTIPVVMLTSSREEKDLIGSYDLGANAYVVKPVAFRDFIQAVSGLSEFWAGINEPPPGSIRPLL